MNHHIMRHLLINAPILLSLMLQGQVLGAVGDHPIGYAPEEPFLIQNPFPSGITEGDLGGLSLDDPKLRVAYAALFRAPLTLVVSNYCPPELSAVLKDLRKRADAATPLLLDIMNKNHNTNFEYAILQAVDEIGTIQAEPYVEYLRRMVRDRPDEICATTNEVTAKFFFDHGTADDVKMMQELAKKRPFLAPSLERAFDLQRLKHPDRSKTTGTASSTMLPPMMQLSVTEKAPEAKPTTSVASDEPPSTTPWSVILVVAASGVLWWLLKRRK